MSVAQRFAQAGDDWWHRSWRASWRVRFVAALMLVGIPLFARAADEPSLQPARPDIYGVWVGTGGYPDIDPKYRNTPLPKLELTPWGVTESRRITRVETPDECKPFGAVAYMDAGNFFPIEFVRAKKGIVMLYEVSPLPRHIYMDGRKHPDDLDPTWLGHSIGRWEGNTLVVDTVGLNGRGRPLNGYISGGVDSKHELDPRLPVSDQMHMVERIRLVGNGDYLEDELTLTDLKSFTKAFTVRHYWQRRRDLDVLEYFCDDNRRPVDEGHAADPVATP